MVAKRGEMGNESGTVLSSAAVLAAAEMFAEEWVARILRGSKILGGECTARKS